MSTTPSANPPTDTVRAPQFVPGWRVWTTIGVCAALIALLRGFHENLNDLAPAFDQAFLNIVTLVLGFIPCLTLVLWCVFRSSYPAPVRYGLAGLIGLAVVMGVVVFRVEEVYGNMLPRFQFRFAKKADQRLEPLAADQTADLSHTTPQDFPEFLGPGRANHLPGPRLNLDWNHHPPEELWRIQIGAGWSAFSAVNGFAVTMEQRGTEELVTCYRIADGSPVWSHAISARHENVLGGDGPRSTPTIHNGKVYALGAVGRLSCLDGATGRTIWEDDLLERYHLTQLESESFVQWGRAASPLIVGDTVIVPAGGITPPLTGETRGVCRSLIAYNKDSGKVLWEGGDQQVSYASPSLGTLAGKQQILIVNERTVAGHDPATGEELWNFLWPGSSKANASSSQAIALSGDRVFVSKGYGGGAALYQITLQSGHWNAELLQENHKALQTKFTNVSIHGKLIFGLSDGPLQCVDAETLKIYWRAGRYDNGQIIGVGDELLVLGEMGELTLVDATSAGHHVRGKTQVLQGKTWNNLCLYGDILLVRNDQWAAAYRLEMTK